MAVVMKIEGTPTGGTTPFDGKYVVKVNFEAGYGTIAVDVTDDPHQALQFGSMEEAATFWKTQSKTQPLRPDGKPNRPLTGVNVSIERVDF